MFSELKSHYHPLNSDWIQISTIWYVHCGLSLLGWHRRPTQSYNEVNNTSKHFHSKLINKHSDISRSIWNLPTNILKRERPKVEKKSLSCSWRPSLDMGASKIIPVYPVTPRPCFTCTSSPYRKVWFARRARCTWVKVYVYATLIHASLISPYI